MMGMEKKRIIGGVLNQFCFYFKFKKKKKKTKKQNKKKEKKKKKDVQMLGYTLILRRHEYKVEIL